MKIVVDAMGGDFAPKVNVDGAIDALREYPDMEIILEFINNEDYKYF